MPEEPVLLEIQQAVLAQLVIRGRHWPASVADRQSAGPALLEFAERTAGRLREPLHGQKWLAVAALAWAREMEQRELLQAARGRLWRLGHGCITGV